MKITKRMEEVINLAVHVERSLERMRVEYQKETGEELDWGLILSALGSVFLNLGLKHAPDKIDFASTNVRVWQDVEKTLKELLGDKFKPSNN